MTASNKFGPNIKGITLDLSFPAELIAITLKSSIAALADVNRPSATEGVLFAVGPPMTKRVIVTECDVTRDGTSLPQTKERTNSESPP